MEISGFYSLPLVILSFIIAAVTSYTALDLVGRLTTTTGYIQKVLLIGGSSAIGLGIWAMHFIAMLAFHLRPNEHNVLLVLVSMILPILSTCAALVVLSRGKLTLPRMVGGIMIMGSGISFTHYAGMSATTFGESTVIPHEVFSFSILYYIIAVGIGIASLMMLGFAIYMMLINRRLKESEKHHQSLFDQNPDLILLLDTQGHICTGNAMVKKVIGYETEEYKGKSINFFVHPDDLPSAHELIRKGLQGVSTEYEVRAKHKHDFLIDLQIKSIPMVIDSEMKGIYVVARDITELKQSRKELNVLSRKHELILNAVADGVYGIDQAGHVVFWNSAAEKITGYKAESVIGHPIHSLIHHTQIDGNHRDKENCPICLSPQGVTYHHKEDIFWNKDGISFPVEYISIPMIENNDIIGSVITFSDITEQKQTEDLIRTSEKLSVAGQLAAGIAHEIRNPLTSIKGFLKLLEGSLWDKKYYVDIMLSEMSRIELILSELLVLSKPQANKSEYEDLRELLEHVITLLGTQGNLQNVQINAEFDDIIPMIECDKNQLKQVFINFIKNSMEAMPNGGEITIQVERREEKKLMIRIIDQGCGISENQINKIGQPFFTTKEKGTGLGFMISKKIIEDHGGTIQIQSQVNEGTTIEVEFPVCTTKRIKSNVKL